MLDVLIFILLLMRICNNETKHGLCNIVLLMLFYGHMMKMVKSCVDMHLKE